MRSTLSADRAGSRSLTRSRLGLGWRPPGSTLTACQHGVEDDDELAHAGEQSDVGLLAVSAQPLVVGLDKRVVASGGGEGCHIEQIADLAAAALLLTWPSSGSQAIAAATNRVPNPGTL